MPRLLIILTLALLAACNSKHTEKTSAPPSPHAQQIVARRQIDSVEALMRATPPQGEADMTRVLEAVRMYQNYVVDYPHDTATPRYLLTEGNVFYGFLHDYAMAEKVFVHLIDSFPKARQRGAGLFFLANTYQDAGDTARALQRLAQLQQEYPTSKLAPMAADLAKFIKNGQKLPTPPTP